MILRYKLRDLKKIYDDYVNDSVEGDFQKALLLFQIGRKTLVEYNVSVTSKPDHPTPPPPGKPPENFLKEFSTPGHKENAKARPLGQKYCAKTPPRGNYFLKSSKKHKS